MGLAGFVIGMMTPAERPFMLFLVGVLVALSILSIGQALKEV